MIELHPRIQSELLEVDRGLRAEGSLPSRAQLQAYYDTFRRQFGPEVLRSLDGEELLDRMHDHGNKDSLVYWLEFKNDETFPAIFGSIAGGSALKFGVFRRAETRTWATRGTRSAPKDITVTEAIEVARRHRDQLVAAAELVAVLPAGADDARYLALQRELARVAPDIQDTAWGHKYLSLLAPDALDDYHVSSYQRYHLARILQLPPRDGNDWAEGRYVCAGRFVSLSQELEIPVNYTTTLLNRRDGEPRSYWRIGTTDDEKARRKYWPMMRDGNIVAIGWPALGDLSGYAYNLESKEAIAALLRLHYPNSPQTVGKYASQLLQFAARIEEGDRVIAADGAMVLGVGEVTGPYSYNASAPFRHQRSVTWCSLVEWKEAESESLRTTVGTIRDPRNQVEIERRILEDADSTRGDARSLRPASPTPGASIPSVRGPLPRLSGVLWLVQSVLERKGQAVLYGPPGTGKTYWALRAARELAALRAFGTSSSDLPKERIHEGSAAVPPLVRVISFHPEYGYEDFIEGYRPRIASDGSLTFALMPGLFRRLCADAAAASDLDFYLVIDEINRGDIPRIFGELLTLLERDKRGEAVILPASGEPFRVPSNVYVLGTMNTADRSIALLDVALRRRFGFIELMPDYALLKGVSISGLPLGPWLADLNRRVRNIGGGDARNRQIGHAFFLGPGGPITTVEQLAAVLRDDVVPLLEEYAYDDFSQLAEMLGGGLVDAAGQRIKRELFEIGRGAELVAALLRPEVATAAAAVMASSAQEELDDDDASDADDTPQGDASTP